MFSVVKVTNQILKYRTSQGELLESFLKKRATTVNLVWFLPIQNIHAFNEMMFLKHITCVIFCHQLRCFGLSALLVIWLGPWAGHGIKEWPPQPSNWEPYLTYLKICMECFRFFDTSCWISSWWKLSISIKQDWARQMNNCWLLNKTCTCEEYCALCFSAWWGVILLKYWNVHCSHLWTKFWHAATDSKSANLNFIHYHS